MTLFARTHMESFNFLKFWRTAAVRDIVDSDLDSVKKFADAMDYVKNPVVESTDEEIDNDEDSFFDLVLTEINGRSKENNNSNPVSEITSSVKQGIDVNPKPHSPKFSVCFLGFRKSKPEKVRIDHSSSTASPKIQTQKGKVENGNRFTVKHNVELGESSINKQFARADMRKYLKLMKPLYSRASKSQSLPSSSVQSLISPRNSAEEKQSNRVAVLGAVRKRLGKSRSTASSFAGVPMNRRDDSLLEQNDGIQGAILHCKRSYSSARKDCSVLLSRNANEDMPRASCEEQNRWSI